ncbi:MAG: PoNe immunity protein domain-containing protein [Oscillospiraceae bacterium]
MRDIIKSKDYFIEYIGRQEKRVERFETKLFNNEVSEDRVLTVKRKICSLKIQIVIAKYSCGTNISEIQNNYIQLIQELPNVWNVDLYVETLWMLCIGIMLEVRGETLAIIKDLIVESQTNDWLFNFLLDKGKSSPYKIEGTIKFEEPYGELQKALIVNNNFIDRFKIYLGEKWYWGHNDSSWYDLHKSKENLYYGYWSFETGAIVKILGLDDSDLKDVPYYPYDMVHYKEN